MGRQISKTALDLRCLLHEAEATMQNKTILYLINLERVMHLMKETWSALTRECGRLTIRNQRRDLLIGSFRVHSTVYW